MNLYEWAIKWGIPIEAIADYRQQVGIDMPAAGSTDGSEAGTLKRVRLEAAQQGILLWRNNVGVARDETDRVIRYGLANDSAALNKRVKSSDLIGIKPGGQFIAREVKRPGWKYTGSATEAAQLRFIELVLANGGDAQFTTGER